MYYGLVDLNYPHIMFDVVAIRYFNPTTAEIHFKRSIGDPLEGESLWSFLEEYHDFVS